MAGGRFAKRILGSFIFFGICFLVLWLFVWIDSNRKINEMASELVKKAEASASSSTTTQDAVQWLKQNDFENIREGGGKIQGETAEYRVVWGWRELREGRWFISPAWLDVYYLFDPKGKFVRVGSNVRHEPIEAPPIETPPPAEKP